MKTILAPGFKARMLGLEGWFSTNILGNRDGEVLDDPENFKTKEMSKLGVLDYICSPIFTLISMRHRPRSPHQLLPAARGRQRRLGQYRHQRVARLSHANQSGLFVPRQHFGRTLGLGSRALHGLCSTRRVFGHSRVAEFLLQEPAVRERTVRRARPIHSVDEAQEHVARMDGRTRRHPLRGGLNRNGSAGEDVDGGGQISLGRGREALALALARRP